jgi:hypothetical protein
MMPVTWRSFRAHFVEALFRNIGYLDRNLIAVCLGFVAAVLLLSARTMPASSLSGLSSWVSYVYAALVLVVLLVLFVVRPLDWDDRPNLFRWGVVTLLLLGFGVGALVYRYRGWFVWIWTHLETINTAPRVLLASLFLLGVIMGFFVVRNWSQDQKDFVSSLTAVFGGGFISTILGKMSEDPSITSIKAFALYAGGFTVSGCANLIASACLAANYSNRHSIVSRAVLDLLYGTDKAKAIDRVFQSNFEEDLNYARTLLNNAVSQFSEEVKRGFAEKMDAWLRKHPNCYELDSIYLKDCETNQKPDELKYTIRYKHVENVLPKMFRVAVSIKWQDNLEYVASPGEYNQPFPYNGSVAGLASMVRETIVMYRDKCKEFRSATFPQGIWPDKLKQSRGLDVIDYLSYITVPLVGHLGKPVECPLGILHVDSKLFVAPDALKGTEDPTTATWTADLPSNPEILRDYAHELYHQNDDAVEYLEQMRKVLVPILELYLKCRQGST